MGGRARSVDDRGARRGPCSRSGPARQAADETAAQAVGVMGVTYDTGALIAAERNDRAMWALHTGFLAEEVVPVVPAPVLAEAWRGGPRQASLVRLLALCVV